MPTYVEPDSITAIYRPQAMAHIPHHSWRELRTMAKRLHRKGALRQPATTLKPAEMAAHLLYGPASLTRQGAAALAREYQSPQRDPQEYWVQVEWIILSA